jgi:hypothetical protein
VIDEGHPDWPALRRYHLHGFRNRPHEYHNGGVWPIWLGWLALALADAGRESDAARLRTSLHERLAAQPGFDFEEYLHGLTGPPAARRHGVHGDGARLPPARGRTRAAPAARAVSASPGALGAALADRLVTRHGCAPARGR